MTVHEQNWLTTHSVFGFILVEGIVECGYSSKKIESILEKIYTKQSYYNNVEVYLVEDVNGITSFLMMRNENEIALALVVDADSNQNRPNELADFFNSIGTISNNIFSTVELKLSAKISEIVISTQYSKMSSA